MLDGGAGYLADMLRGDDEPYRLAVAGGSGRGKLWCHTWFFVVRSADFVVRMRAEPAVGIGSDGLTRRGGVGIWLCFAEMIDWRGVRAVAVGMGWSWWAS